MENGELKITSFYLQPEQGFQLTHGWIDLDKMIEFILSREKPSFLLAIFRFRVNLNIQGNKTVIQSFGKEGEQVRMYIRHLGQ